MEKLLTVSVAAYNVEKYIEETLTPFTKISNFERIEVLIIDDGSTDLTIDIAQKFVDRWPSVFKIIHKENGGWGSTVNIGIEQANGKYFKLLDGDDYYNCNELELFLADIENATEDVILTPYEKFYDGTEKRDVIKCSIFDNDASERIVFSDLPITPFCLEMYMLSFRTSILKKGNLRITEHCFYTDNEYVMKGLSQCKTCRKMPYALYCYRVGRIGQSVSIQGMEKHYEEFEHILKTMLVFNKDVLEESHLQAIFFKRYTGLSYYYFETLFSLKHNKQFIHEIEEYDRWLKNNFFNIYSNITYRPIRIYRFFNYRMFNFARLFK